MYVKRTVLHSCQERSYKGGNSCLTHVKRHGVFVKMLHMCTHPSDTKSALSLSPSLPLPRARARALSLFLVLLVSLALTLAFSRALSRSLSRALSRALFFSLFSLSLSPTRTLSLSLSLSHTHTHTHAHIEQKFFTSLVRHTSSSKKAFRMCCTCAMIFRS